MKIAFFEIEKYQEDYIRGRLKKHELIFFKGILNNKNIKYVKNFDIVSVFIYSNLNKNIINKFEKLKAIITRSTGFEHIDIEECKKKKIKILNIPFYGGNTVAEHTFALILDLSRKIHESYTHTTKGDFSLKGLRGFDLKGKIIGIIGVGNIGIRVARIAKGFEMNILAYDLKKNKKVEKSLGVKYCSLNNLLKKSDIISLHCPHNKKTHYLINKENIKLIKKGAYLINTARGGLIETDALVKALLKKQLGGAGLDVIEEESLIKEEAQLLSKNFPKKNLSNLIKNHLLLTFKGVVITPHNAFNSKESLQRILDVSLENIKSILENKSSKNLVT